jgi:hypothetical protein
MRMNWSDLYLQLRGIAGIHSEPPKKPFHVYVIKVVSAPDVKQIDYYVGSTGNTLENRFRIHLSGEGTAARIFKNGKYRPVSFKEGWMDKFPVFHDETSVREAEGVVAEFLISKGYVVNYSNKEFTWPEKISGPTNPGEATFI